VDVIQKPSALTHYHQAIERLHATGDDEKAFGGSATCDMRGGGAFSSSPSRADARSPDGSASAPTVSGSPSTAPIFLTSSISSAVAVARDHHDGERGPQPAHFGHDVETVMPGIDTSRNIASKRHALEPVERLASGSAPPSSSVPAAGATSRAPATCGSSSTIMISILSSFL